MTEYLTVVLSLAGTAFLLLAAVGAVRMPDIFARMHATTKAATLGTSLMLLAVAVHFGHFGIATRAIAIIAFLFLTAPVVAHMLGRAAHFIGVPLWKGTVIDEFDTRYNPEPAHAEHDNGEPASEPARTSVSDYDISGKAEQ